MEFEIMETVLMVGGVFFALPFAILIVAGVASSTVELAMFVGESAINIVTFPFT